MGSFAFPLFASDMFTDLTYKWSNTLFAGIALVIVPIPFVSQPLLAFPPPPTQSNSQVLFFYGSSLRKRSRLCSKVTTPEQDAASKAEASNVNTPRSSG